MKYTDSISGLFVQFPELKTIYETEGDYIEGLPHLCYSIVFVPFVIQACLIGDDDKIKEICSFMEGMANSDYDDERVSELLVVSVLESILSEREIIRSLKRYLGISTLKLLSILENETGWDQ